MDPQPSGSGVNICPICDKELSPEDKHTIGPRAIDTVITASKKRKDKKYLTMSSLQSLHVHKSCYVMYIRESSIKAANSKANEANAARRRHSSGNFEFDFSAFCLFCGDCADKTSTRRLGSNETVQNILTELQLQPTSVFNTVLKERLENNINLCEKNAWYHTRCMTRFYVNRPTNKGVGRPITEHVSSTMAHIINYILNNFEDSQMSLTEILKDFKGELPHISTIKTSLSEYFKDDIVMYSVKNDLILCFRNARENILREDWYTKKNQDERLEKLRIVKMASEIILQDIRVKAYDTDNYKAPSAFLENVFEDVPETLKLMLDTLIKTHKRPQKGNSENIKWSNRVGTIAHMIISSARPRSFLSPLLLGLSSMIHRKHASKGLIDCLSYLGLCSTYNETVQFESAIANSEEHYKYSGDYFVQFAFDNADHNTNTIDGRDTFHAMGGIMCVTPSSAVATNTTIKRPTEKGEILNGRLGYVPLKQFVKGTSEGLKNIKIIDLNTENMVNNRVNVTHADILWFYGKQTQPNDIPGWSGFMEEIYKFRQFETTKVVPLPFVNAPPSSSDTIFTVLIEAAQKCKVNNQNHCFVTFDQPLYYKAREIIASIDRNVDPYNLKSIIVRLGGFHTLMSFLGSIGFIMEGSGLKEAFSVLFAENSAEKALTGHAFSRAIRGHTLIQTTLAHIILASLNLNETETNFLNSCLSDTNDFENLVENDVFNEIKNKFALQVDKIKENGPTAQLWAQYFEMVTIVKRFIEAERSGNWALHLQSMQQMLPYFHSSGHYLYAKSCHLYLQDMFKLESTMNIFEFDQFCKSGYFTIRRSCKYWSGIWSDMTIEQVLMRAMKTSGGLTHGRGMTESVISTWILSTVALMEVCNEMEKFCNVSYTTSEQHIDCRVTRIKRDALDLEKLKTFFALHDPFPYTSNIMSIFSGVVGDSNINCHKALEVGITLQKNVTDNNFGTVKFQRKNKVISLRAVNSRIRIDDEIIPINPLLIFQRICLNIKSKDDMKNYLNYELAPLPVSLFDEAGMRKTQKSVFYENFEPLADIPTAAQITYVIDGGFLLHRVMWHQNDIIDQILQKYISYIKNHYSLNACVIFDGYPEEVTNSNTKSSERLRRQAKNVGREIIFDEHTKITISQNAFFMNEKNKMRLIKMLIVELEKSGFQTKCAEEDADLLIVQTALELSENNTVVKIVGEDIDLLVILTQLSPTDSKVLFVKAGKSGETDKVYSGNSFKYEILKHFVGFLHTFTGCDTTSCFYNQGKNKLVKLLYVDSNLREAVRVCYEKNSDHSQISKAGCNIIAKMYCTKKETGNLNELRFLHFQKSTTRSTSFKLESLPPTEEAAAQHCYRVYFQLQQWFGNVKDATQWGWKIHNNSLQPVYSSQQLIPTEILQTIFCRCESGCKSNTCGCRKHGLRCSSICSGCRGTSCDNVEKLCVDENNLENDLNDLTDLNGESNFSSTQKIVDESDGDDCETVTKKLRKQ